MHYKCSICGYEFEGELTDSFVCPRCKQPADKFVLAAPEPTEKVEAQPSEAAPVDLAYDPALLRQDSSQRYMKEIQTMAVTGKSLHGAMSTEMPLPSWDEILLLGAQLNPPPLADDAEVITETIIGKHAKKPMVLQSPIYISHMSFGALSRECK